MTEPPFWAEQGYRLLLRAHPRAFRDKYEGELLACFRDAWCEEAAHRGVGRVVRFCARTAAGTLVTAARQRTAKPERGRREGMMVDSIRRDLRVAVRGLLRHPGWAAVVVLTLGLGMGATTSVFSVLNAVLLAPLPFPGGDRLVRVYLRNVVNGSEGLYLSAPASAELRDRVSTLEAVAVVENYNVGGATLTGPDSPKRVRVLRVNAEYFDALGTKPYLGRPFRRSEERPDARVAVLTQRLWEESLGADPSALERSITLDEHVYSVVGVVPGSPRDPLAGEVDVWLPADLAEADTRGWDNNYLSAYARLSEGASVELLRTDLARLTELHADMGEDAAEKAYTVLALKDDLVGDARPLLTALMGAVAFLFLLTCTNVASLMLARAATREHEFGIRAALGSARRHLVSQTLVESGVIAVAGGIAGLALGAIAMDTLLALAPLDLPLRESVGLGTTPVLFAAALSAMVAMALGLVVALPYAVGAPRHTSAMSARAGRGGPVARRTRDALVVVDVAFAVILLVGAGLLLRTLDALRGQELGVDPTDVVAFQVDLPETRYGAAEARVRFQDELMARLSAIPGVEAVGSASHLPVTGSHNTWGTRPASATGEAADMDNLQVNQRFVDEDYLDAVGLELIAGRRLDGTDGAAQVPSVLLNRTAARALYGDTDPLGRRLAVGPLRPVIVGVVEDEWLGARLGPAPTVYHAYDQFGAGRRWSHYHVVRMAPGQEASWPAIREALTEVDPALVVHGTVYLEDVVGADIAEERFAGVLLWGFAGLGMLLAALGLFGVLSHSVQRRRHEIGVRIAMGARAPDVSRRVLRKGLELALGGTGVGLAAAYMLSQGLEFLVFGVSARDPLVFAGASVLVALVTLASSWVPARRATTVDPLELLRSE